MKIRSKMKVQKIEPQMAPMIDVVFLLLIFFMLTLKIIAPEGDFNINMPTQAPGPPPEDLPHLPAIKVRLRATPDGSLAQISLGLRSLGNDAKAFERLNYEILNIIGRPGNPHAKEIEVEIDADYDLHYRYVISAVGACTGRLDPSGQKVIRYIEKIKFTPPKRPPRSAPAAGG